MGTVIAKTITSWSDSTTTVSEHNASEKWIYRGHRCSKWPLKSTFERALNDWGKNLNEGADIEEQMIRDFRRRNYGGHSIVDSDTLHCLALMQHHSAPTRLLDWTYSPYVAARFAIESGSTCGSVWCLSTKWCEEAAVKIVGPVIISKRNKDRDDTSFKRLYMGEWPVRRFVFTENPYHLNPRLVVQQGLFLCPGDVGATFVDNLQAMEGWRDERYVLKLDLDLSKQGVREFASILTRMNVDRSALFPGLDGFSRSLGERIPLYSDIAKNRT